MLVLSLVVAVLAVARLTRLLTEDRLAVRYRRWVVERYGEDSMPAYMAHCTWCTSIYVAILLIPATVLIAAPYELAVKAMLALLAVPAASMLTGLLLERRK